MGKLQNKKSYYTRGGAVVSKNSNINTQQFEDYEIELVDGMLCFNEKEGD